MDQKTNYAKNSEKIYTKNVDYENLPTPIFEDEEQFPFSNKYTDHITNNLIAELDIFVSEKDKAELLELAKNAKYETYYSVLHMSNAEHYPIVQKFMKKFEFLKDHIFGCIFLKFNPHEMIKPHADPIRYTSIYFPLFENDYSPLEIYFEDKKYGVTKNDNQSFYIWDAKKIHAVFNNNNTRYNFQFLVSLPYHKVLDSAKKEIGIRKRKDAYLRYDVKSYFSKVVPTWRDNKILDWGCNHSNFLHFNNKENIDYTGCDIDSDIIDRCRESWPEHKWLYYNHFNWQYSKTLEDGKWPLKESYDSILTFSVYTHTDQFEMLSDLSKLKNNLSPNGRIYLTFFSTELRQSWIDIVKYRYEYFKESDIEIWNEIKDCYTCSVSVKNGNVKLYKDQTKIPRFNCDYFITYYNDDYIKEITNGRVLEVNKHFDSGILSNQKCVAIKNEKL